MGDEVWVLGATGRSGRAIAAQLAASGVPVALVGRDSARLEQVSDVISSGGAGVARTVVAGSLAAMTAQVQAQRPAVVVNTVGPFASTSIALARACLASSHYLDLANDVTAVSGLLDLHDEAVAAGRTLVTGAGFGVLATESVVAKLCQGRPPAARVRVDALPSVELEAGAFGEALAGTILDGVPEGGRRYEHGHLVRTRFAGDLAHLTLPDGTSATTAGWPAGELIAAQRASGAAFVVAASSEIPIGPAVRAALPLASALLSITPVRNLAKRRLGRVTIKARKRPREHSWAHARVQWADDTVREGWLRVGDASSFTAATAVLVATRLADRTGPPGAYTPTAAFGPDLATDAGGHFILD